MKSRNSMTAVLRETSVIKQTNSRKIGGTCCGRIRIVQTNCRQSDASIYRKGISGHRTSKGRLIASVGISLRIVLFCKAGRLLVENESRQDTCYLLTKEG